MKLHLITIGQPKLPYAKSGWQEYWQRLGHYHSLRVTHIPDKHNDATHILEAAQGSYIVTLDLAGQQFTSMELAKFIEKRALESREVSLIIGGPEGLPKEILAQAKTLWSLSQLTFPHDLAMIVLLEALYRASTINAGQPYHK